MADTFAPMKLCVRPGILLFSIIASLFSSTIIAQTGKISGRVISSKTGVVLIGATISIDSLNRSMASDLNGSYSFSGLVPGNYTVSATYVSYLKKVVTEVSVITNQTTELIISLDEPTISSNNEVIVTTRLRRENIGSLLAAQKNSASTSDGISAEQIRKTPDRNMSDVLKRVSGASIQEDRFAIIRGLNDRYNAAFLNGSPLPSSESDRKAFAFNIFPSNIIDNLIIYKTATPDRTGEFGGGIIEISTKSIPSENFTSLAITGGYNTTATFKEEYKYKGGKWDFLGVDDGTRAIPDAINRVPNLQSISLEERGNLAKTFNNNWGLDQGRFSPNYGLQFTKGLNVQRKGNDFLGMIFSLTYSKNSSFLQGQRESYQYDRLAAATAPELEESYNDNIYINQTLFGALLNTSVKLSNKSTISFKNLLSLNGDDRVIRREGLRDAQDPTFITRLNARWFTSNSIYSSQLSGDHILSKSNLRLNWMGSYAAVDRDIPGLRQSIYTSFGGSEFNASVVNNNGLVPQSGGSSFNSTTKENILNGKLDLSQPFALGGSRNNVLKAGFYYQKRSRDFYARLLGIGRLNSNNFDNSLLSLPEDKIFAPQNIGMLANGKQGFVLVDLYKPSYIYDASSEIFAGYLMADQRFAKKFRAVYGARLEHFQQILNTTDDQLVPLVVNTSKLDLLPSANIIYSINSKQNVRVSYSRTLNRPEFRELAPFLFYDFVTRFNVEGSSTLTRASIDNYDVRYEIYPGRSQLFSLSGFYKEFTNPIELVSISGSGTLQAKYQNALKAEVYGMEVEMRSLLSTLFLSSERSILNKLTLAANGSILWSDVNIAPIPGITDPKAYISNRSLQGQSPYVINSSLTYADDDRGFSATVSGNRVGDRIFIVGTVSDVDIYEKGRTVLDMQVAKTFKQDKWEVRLTARDILAQNLLFYADIDSDQKYDKSVDKVFTNYRPGSTVSASVSYKFNRKKVLNKLPFIN